MMEPPQPPARPALIAVAAVLIAACAAALPAAGAQRDGAYVTLLYGDEFVLGVRVLGKSIRDTGATRDMLVLVSDGVSAFAERLLKADGWIVKRISLLANPNQIRPKRFWGVYTKLKIFNLTEYRKVVYLDADTVVVKSVEELFDCGKFCANLKHSERLNSGVMVVEPSEELFLDMMDKVNSLPSYTGGDQGFLNSYYGDFANAHIFEPNSSGELQNLASQPETQRLSTLYNADVGLYMLANKWMVDENDLKVIHYTLGPLKPWDWWTAWLVKPVEVWQDIRQSLEDSLPGTAGGRNPHHHLMLLFILPVFMLLIGFYLRQTNRDVLGMRFVCLFARQVQHKYKSEEVLSYSDAEAASSVTNSNRKLADGTHLRLSSILGPISVLSCFMFALLSLGLSFIVIPRQVVPWTGLLLLYEWTYVLFFLLFGSYLRLIYFKGIEMANNVGHGGVDTSENRGHHRASLSSDCENAALYYWIGMALLAALAPSLPIFLGITALFAKLGLMVGGGVLLAAFMTFAAEHMAVAALAKGQRDRHVLRARNICV